MEFTVGDKVLVTHKIEIWEDNCWVVEMNRYVGKILTVVRVYEHSCSCILNDADISWNYSKRSLRHLNKIERNGQLLLNL